MTGDVGVIAVTAASLGFIHTLFGPDHYLPFVMIGKARSWSLPKIAFITVLCGLGHVLSSIILGAVGIALGIAVSNLEGIEGTRGELASYLLMAFGLAYGVWGLRNAWKKKPHRHFHLHNGENHDHEHSHDEHTHAHPHPSADGHKSVTVWALFVVFVLGPCEPLIPLLMFPAAAHSWAGVAFVATVFGVVTIATMTTITILLSLGFHILPTQWLERYIHAIAGFVIALSGAAIVFLGL